MKSLNKTMILMAVILGLSVGSAFATNFQYQYTFNSGMVVTGTLVGDQNGLYVENVSDVSIFFNGIETPGIITASGNYDLSTGWTSSLTLSFDATLNNFIFHTGEVVTYTGIDAYFYMMNVTSYPHPHAYAVSTPLSTGHHHDQPQVAANWSLHSVPDNGTTFVMLGLTMLGLARFRLNR